MKILGVYLQNFGSFYGRHYINLSDRGLVSVVGENWDDPRAKSNGSGKSTWSGGLDWCLWGEVPSGDVVDSIINEEAQGGCCVTTFISDDSGGMITVTRLRNYPGHPNGPILKINGANKSALDATETQRLIEMHLGMDREVGHSALLFAQGDRFVFADAKDTERKDILTKIIPELGQVDVYQTHAEFLLQKAQSELTGANNVAYMAKTHLATLESQDPRPAANQWEAGKVARLDALAQAANKAQMDVNGATYARNLIQSQTPPQPQQPVQPDLKSLHTVVEQQRQWLQKVQGDIAGLMGVAKEQQRRLENYKMLPDSCVTCGQKVPHEHKDGMLHKEQSNLNDTVKKAQHLREQEAQAQSSLNLAVEGANTAQQQWSKTQQQAYEQMKSFKDAQGKLTTAEWELKACQQTLAQAAAQYNAALHEQNPHAARAIEWATVLWPKADAAARQAALSAQILEKRVAVLTYWVTGLGTKGLKSYVLDGKVAEMTEEANRWVRFLTGGTIWVEFKTQREVGKGKTKKAVEDLSLYVHRAFPDGTVVRRNYRSWSGGEKSKVALGIDFGLARLVAKRASRAYDLLILDEVFQKDLDYSGKEAVAEMLVALSKEKSSIFVVDHDAGFQHLFSGRMVVRKHQRRSRVVEGIYYGVEPKGSQDSSKESDFLSTHTAFPG